METEFVATITQFNKHEEKCINGMAEVIGLGPHFFEVTSVTRKNGFYDNVKVKWNLKMEVSENGMFYDIKKIDTEIIKDLWNQSPIRKSTFSMKEISFEESNFLILHFSVRI